jgi:hypothetical protein
MGDVKTPANNYLYSDKHELLTVQRKNPKYRFLSRGAKKFGNIPFFGAADH